MKVHGANPSRHRCERLHRVPKLRPEVDPICRELRPSYPQKSISMRSMVMTTLRAPDSPEALRWQQAWNRSIICTCMCLKRSQPQHPHIFSLRARYKSNNKEDKRDWIDLCMIKSSKVSIEHGGADTSVDRGHGLNTNSGPLGSSKHTSYQIRPLLPLIPASSLFSWLFYCSCCFSYLKKSSKREVLVISPR